MSPYHRSVMLALGGMVLLWATSAGAAPTDAQKCEADKLKRAALYSACRLKAESKAVRAGDLPDYTKCDQNIVGKFGAAETKYGAECPTSGDVGDIQSQVTTDSDVVALKLAGERFVDNADGTVTDVETGLMWEQKDDGGGIHDKDNFYTWSTGTNKPDGTAFTDFLGTLNNGTSPDGTAVSGCFAGHCDWRLPMITELQTIVDLTKGSCSGGSGACIDETVFGPTQALTYWSTTTTLGGPNVAQGVNFLIGLVGAGEPKTYNNYVRAVRSGL